MAKARTRTAARRRTAGAPRAHFGMPRLIPWSPVAQWSSLCRWQAPRRRRPRPAPAKGRLPPALMRRGPGWYDFARLPAPGRRFWCCGASASSDRLACLAESLADHNAAPLLEATVVLTVYPDQRRQTIALTRVTAEQLGVSEIVLLAIRPDGHVGLRADRNHLQAWSDYCALLTSGLA